MELHEYKWKFDTTYQAIAEKAGCSRTYLNGVAKKSYTPSKHMARSIEIATEGLVTIEELMNPDKQKTV